MIIITCDTGTTFKAQIIQSTAPRRVLYTGTCTMGAEQAAKNLVEKWFGAAAADRVQQLRDCAEIDRLAGDYIKSPQRKQVFQVWTFGRHAVAAAAPSTSA